MDNSERLSNGISNLALDEHNGHSDNSHAGPTKERPSVHVNGLGRENSAQSLVQSMQAPQYRDVPPFGSPFPNPSTPSASSTHTMHSEEVGEL